MSKRRATGAAAGGAPGPAGTRHGAWPGTSWRSIFSPGAADRVIDEMARLAAARSGWINFLPGVLDEDVQEPGKPSAFSTLFGMSQAPVTMATWIPAKGGRRNGDEVTIGIMHPRGRYAIKQLAGLGVPLPDGWRVRQDHNRRGLIVLAPAAAANVDVLDWTCRASEALSHGRPDRLVEGPGLPARRRLTDRALRRPRLVGRGRGGASTGGHGGVGRSVASGRPGCVAPGGARRVVPETDEYRIADLAREAGTTVRNIRAYQDRGLIPPPRRTGRIVLYSQAHLLRLRLIGTLLERGFTLANIGELMALWERGQGIGALLGAEAALVAPWADHSSATMSAEELVELLGPGPGSDAAALARAIEIGIFERRRRPLPGHLAELPGDRGAAGGRGRAPRRPAGDLRGGPPGHRRRGAPLRRPDRRPRVRGHGVPAVARGGRPPSVAWWSACVPWSSRGSRPNWPARWSSSSPSGSASTSSGTPATTCRRPARPADRRAGGRRGPSVGGPWPATSCSSPSTSGAATACRPLGHPSCGPRPWTAWRPAGPCSPTTGPMPRPAGRRGPACTPVPTCTGTARSSTAPRSTPGSPTWPCWPGPPATARRSSATPTPPSTPARCSRATRPSTATSRVLPGFDPVLVDQWEQGSPRWGEWLAAQGVDVPSNPHHLFHPPPALPRGRRARVDLGPGPVLGRPDPRPPSW